MGLIISVDQQYLFAFECKSCTDIDDGSGLCNAAFLIGNGNDFCF